MCTVVSMGAMAAFDASLTATISPKCNLCSCVHSLVAFEWSHRRKSYAIFEAIFLNPMLVPAQITMTY